MRRTLAAALALVAFAGSGCFLVFFEEGFGLGLVCLAPPDPCSCLAICELDYRGQALVLGECVPPTLLAECRAFARLDAGPALPRIPPGTSYQAPAGAWFALGSYRAGADAGQQIGFPIDGGVVETYRAVANYPAEFVWRGFDALGGQPVGAFGFDLDLDGVVDFEVPVLPVGADEAYVDVDRSGSPSPLDVTVQHVGSHQIVVTLPFGGDGTPTTLASGFALNARVTLRPGVMANPATPGPQPVSVDFTSVDADTGDADDAMGDDPASFTVGDQVEIASGPCPPAPAPGCSAGFAGALSIVDRGGERRKLALKLKRGALEEDAFGHPATSTSHATCLYDGSDALVAELPVEAGGSDARGKPLWKEKKRGTRYANRAGNAAGVTSVKQRGGPKATVKLRGKGAALALPGLPLAVPLVVQHRTLEGACAEVVFDTLAKNEAGRLKARVR